MKSGVAWCACGAAILIAACSGSPTEPSPTPLSVSLNSASWETISDPQPYLLSNQGSALTLNLPSTGSLHYLFTASALAAIHGTLVVSLTISTTGPVVFNSLDLQSASCSLPTAVRPFFWSNDNGEGAYDRWWSNPRAVTLAPGSGSVTVPLKPEHWSSVNGKFGNADSQATFNFERALLHVTRLGVTFGGGCSFGHGITISGGTASLALTDYSIR